METSRYTTVILDKAIARRVARELLSISSIQFSVHEPFTWVSGIKSPVYCDNRKIMSYPASRAVIVDAFVEIISNHFRDVEVIAGVATGGIPMGVLIAEKMNLPFIYVRQAPKDHGLMRQVEGAYSKGAKVVLVEDHISTGGSSLKAIEGLLDEELNVLALISIMTYNFKNAIDKFKYYQINHISLSDLDTILRLAVEENLIGATDAETIIAFRDDPNTWNAL